MPIKRIGAMKPEDFESSVDGFRRCRFFLRYRKQTDRIGQVVNERYLLLVRLADGMDMQFFLDQAQYQILSHCMAWSSGMYDVRKDTGYVRVLVGKRNDGSVYHFAEFVPDPRIAKDFNFRGYLSSNQEKFLALYPESEKALSSIDIGSMFSDEKDVSKQTPDSF